MIVLVIRSFVYLFVFVFNHEYKDNTLREFVDFIYFRSFLISRPSIKSHSSKQPLKILGIFYRIKGRKVSFFGRI